MIHDRVHLMPTHQHKVLCTWHALSRIHEPQPPHDDAEQSTAMERTLEHDSSFFTSLHHGRVYDLQFAVNV